MPKTNLHQQPDNLMEQRLWGKVPIERATALFYFQKGSAYQQLIHDLKYRGNEKLGRYLGQLGAIDLLECVDFATIDAIVPVPLSRQKEYKRGYNQSLSICTGLAEVLKRPLCKGNLRRMREKSSQTQKSTYERFVNMAGLFELAQPDDLFGQHILLVDDVLTTGSTIEACAKTLLEVKGVRVSVFTLALAI